MAAGGSEQFAGSPLSKYEIWFCFEMAKSVYFIKVLVFLLNWRHLFGSLPECLRVSQVPELLPLTA